MVEYSKTKCKLTNVGDGIVRAGEGSESKKKT